MKTTCTRCDGTGQHAAGFGGGTCDCDTCCGRGYLGEDDPPACKATLDLRGQPCATPNYLLDLAIAEHVLGREVNLSERCMRLPDEIMRGQSFESWVSIPCYSTDANAIIELLDCQASGRGWSSSYMDGQSLEGGHYVCDGGAHGRGTTFPMAAAIALLRANGVEVLT